MRLKHIRTGLCSLFCIAIFSTAMTTSAFAQDPRRGYGVGVAGQGTDMWTQAMSGLRLFTPHRNNCDDTTTPTEVFVKVYTNSNNIDFGFCMDKDEHSAGVIEWEDARKECLDDGKRLPEPGEWKYACDSATGLNNMTDDWEYSSNYVLQFLTTSNVPGISTAVNGSGSCNKAGYSMIGYNNGSTPHTRAFRCVR